MSHTEPPASSGPADGSADKPAGLPATPQGTAAVDPSTRTAPAARAPRRLVGLTVGLALAVLALDQLTKWWAESTLELGADPIPVLGDLLSLRLLYNPGAALSIATGMTWLLTIVVTVVVVVIVRMVSRIRSRAWAVALGMLLGGAVGNLLDRLFREPGFARGEVVDFIDYAGFFVGNVADIAVVGAAVMIAVLSVVGIGLDGTRHGRAVEPAESDQATGTAAAGTAAAGTAGAGAPADDPAAEGAPETGAPEERR